MGCVWHRRVYGPLAVIEYPGNQRDVLAFNRLRIENPQTAAGLDDKPRDEEQVM
jgi:hypothetical protein